MKFLENYNIPTLRRVLKLMGRKRHIYNAFIYLFCLQGIVWTVLGTVGIKGVMNSITNHDYELFWRSIVYIILSNVLWWTYAPISEYVTRSISFSSLKKLKVRLCDHLMHLSMTFHDSTPKAEVLSLLTNDVDGIEQIYNWSFFKLLNSIIGGLGGVVVIMVLDYRLALIVIAVGTVSVYISSYYSKKIEQIGKEKQEALSKSSTDAYELIKAAKTIRLLKLYDSITKRFNKSMKEESRIKVSSGTVTSRMKAINIGLSSVSYIVTLFIGALFVYFKLSDWGTVVAITGLKYLTDDLFVEAGGFMALMQQNIACAKRVFKVLDTPRETMNDNSSFNITNTSCPAVLNNISFGYNEKDVISNFSMSIHDNKLTILVGESGCGKSTIMKLLLGLYTPQGGEVTFRGSEKVTLESLRQKTAYVPQDTKLFGDSIYQNIAYGNEKATREDIIHVANLAGAHEFIHRLNNGYETVLYDDGANLSGGQKQRILIARALLKDSQILLLDEITSALDNETESKIMSTIKEISRSKAVVFITHKEKVTSCGDVVYRMA